MSSRKERVRYHLDSLGIHRLDFPDIKAILRAADELIATGGRTMLTKILKGSKDKKLPLCQNRIQRKAPCCCFYGKRMGD